MFTTFVSNLSNAVIRREQLHGRTHIVAPVAMLTEGVHNGSHGPLLYRKGECSRAVPAWNMKPIVVYHPSMNGVGVSACDPTVLEKQQVGILMNTRWDGKLRAECWIDEDQANAVDERVIEALEENKIMEVSTGLFVDNSGDSGEWNGEAYVGEAVNHQPDHLALLPDRIGACSVADGAGLLQLNEVAQAHGIDPTHLFAREMDFLRRMVGNAMSHSNTYSALCRALREKLGGKPGGPAGGPPKDEGPMAWVEDVYDAFFIYSIDGEKTLFKLGYTATDSGVALEGEPEEVVRVTEYRTVAGEFVGNAALDNKEIKMTKKELVDGLIANAKTPWQDGDRKKLMGMDEDFLTRLAPVANDDGDEDDEEEGEVKKPKTKTDPETPPATPAADDQPVTMEAFLAKAPPELRSVLTNSLAAHAANKKQLVQKIMACNGNMFSEEFLMGKELDELSGIAALAGANATQNEQHNPVPMFLGANTPGGPVSNEGNDEDPLDLPTVNWRGDN